MTVVTQDLSQVVMTDQTDREIVILQDGCLLTLLVENGMLWKRIS